MDYGLGKHYEMPEVEITSRARTLALGPNPATPPDPADNPVWMRWNNYGIGLLDAQQYAESERAFEQVVKLRAGLCRRLYQCCDHRLFVATLRTARAPIWRKRCSLLRIMPARFTILRWLIAFKGILTLPLPIYWT